MMIEGSGSGRPKNMWIRIRNTGYMFYPFIVITYRYLQPKKCDTSKGEENIYRKK